MCGFAAPSETHFNPFAYGFSDINLFDTGPFGTKRWTNVSYRLEQLLQPIDEQIASIVRARLRPHSDNARQIVHLFGQNAAILRRPAVMKLLAPEREQFASAAHQLIDEVRTALAAGAFRPDAALQLSPVCNECQWLSIYERQLGDVQRISGLLDGHAQQEQLQGALTALLEEIGTMLAGNFRLWREQSLAAVQSGDLT